MKKLFEDVKSIFHKYEVGKIVISGKIESILATKLLSPNVESIYCIVNIFEKFISVNYNNYSINIVANVFDLYNLELIRDLVEKEDRCNLVDFDIYRRNKLIDGIITDNLCTFV